MIGKKCSFKIYFYNEEDNTEELLVGYVLDRHKYNEKDYYIVNRKEGKTGRLGIYHIECFFLSEILK